ncbi:MULTISPECIES: trans-aconitate 2-methyltransferase [unclassified Haladaptatus]|uniref:class I SAM-dependent methyltransferase n=1 Tax=unclassified Haladaptatus TaxID=2622732 RepID=UPI0023E7BAB8|nr:MULTISPECIES: class I SAM-dependent methyltransferase [unclassified Haladaptatus]
MTDDGTISTYDSRVTEYTERNHDRSVIEAEVREFLRHVERKTPRETARIADVGCGPGFESTTFAAAGHDMVGVDLTPDFLHAARADVPNAEFTRMDMRTLGLASDSLDGLWACAPSSTFPAKTHPRRWPNFGVSYVRAACSTSR